MRILLIIVLLFYVNFAQAQSLTLDLKVTQLEADIIWKGLRKLPVEEVEQLMQKLRQQVVEQTTPKQLPTKEPNKK